MYEAFVKIYFRTPTELDNNLLNVTGKKVTNQCEASSSTYIMNLQQRILVWKAAFSVKTIG